MLPALSPDGKKPLEAVLKRCLVTKVIQQNYMLFRME